ncbi:MAG TPA: PIN/TRAM domain-containing protein, partial [Candidatus Dormibacteraeota bacterium]|nr:PIN/TRAM domain-containing protein [Candidatus Dormibacteraeota bacterium]
MVILDTLLLIVIILMLVFRNGFKTKSKSNRRVVLDTSGLIDGRILELSKSGFIPDELIIPEFIIHELQMLADGSDSRKRARARYGLDVVKELQNSPNSKVTINKMLLSDSMQTDDKLVKLAKKLNVSLYTTDYNLNKVADISGVIVLNVNELA